MNKIINTLKMDGNWASRQQKINRSSRKAAVNEQTVNNIAKSHSKKITIDEYNRLLEQFLKIDKTDEKYNEYFPCPIQKFDKNVFDDLMDKKLEMITNDVMARRILTTIEDYSENRINEIVVTLDSDLEYCPYCFRSINNTEKQSIIDRIKSVLSKESDAFINDLEKLKLMPYIIKSLPDFVDDLIRSKYVLACEHYNKTVDKINGFIEKKKVNLYSSLSTTLSKDYFLVYQNIESVIGEINTMISLHNTSIDKYEEMQNDLKEYCNYLSWETIKDLYNDYLDKKNKMTEISKRHLYLENEILILNEKLDDLNSKKKNVKDASTEINKSLAFIFLDNNRLSLRLHNDHYIVLSNGQQVPLDKLSTGERNIISLCYFFCSIGERKNTKHRYNDEYLIFIDDPISSFDHDNKIGIYSLLRNKIKEFKNSNFIFLTHNYEVGYNLAKIFNDVYGIGNPTGKDQKHITNYIEIKECKVSSPVFDLSQGKNQYKLLLQEVFKYSCGTESKINDFTIGNSLRRILEMFSSFEYNLSLERIVDKIEEDHEINIILKDYMYRILVNNESHSMLSAYAYDEVNRYEMFSSEEKRMTAKLSLIMLDILNDKHISSYLGTENLEILKSWQSEIETSISFKMSKKKVET